MNKQPNPLQLLAALVIDFFRWSQLTPMILLWAFMLAMLLALLVVGNQEATFDLIGWLGETIARLPWVGPKFVAWMEAKAQAQDGATEIHLGKMDLKSAVLTAWGVISAVFMFLAWIASHFFGPFKPWTLKRKMGWTAVACLLVIALFMLLYFLDRESWNDPPSKALFTSSAMSIILFIVSAWCLMVSHVLGWLSHAIAKSDFSQPASDDGLL
jgi:uncharacterized membrane protein YdcZ (DUF606 family)